MGLFSRFKKPKKSGGLGADLIECGEKNYLIWKWHPNMYKEGTLKREDMIRTSSVLHVKSGEVAVFVYKQKKKGIFEDYIVGPYEETLKTKNFPVLEKIIGAWYEGDTPFRAEVYFINLAQAIQINFAVPYFDIVDPRHPDFSVPVAVRGTMTFNIQDYENFAKLNRLMTFELVAFKKMIFDSVARFVKGEVAKAPAENDISLISIESKLDLINESVEIKLKDKMAETFGINVTGFDISAIELDKSSDAYQELKRITKDIDKDITIKKADIDLKNYEESLRIQREEGQYAQRMATKQTNLGAYQTEVSGTVGVASAEALGKMGENGVGNINLGNGFDSTFNPMTMMAGISLGNAIGQKMVGTLNTALSPETPGSVPPPVPTIKYFVAKDGKAIGPFDLETLKSMISIGELNQETLIWKDGMPEWKAAKTDKELSKLFPPKVPE